jgi:hypothetical protein
MLLLMIWFAQIRYIADHRTRKHDNRKGTLPTKT